MKLAFPSTAKIPMGKLKNEVAIAVNIRDGLALVVIFKTLKQFKTKVLAFVLLLIFLMEAI